MLPLVAKALIGGLGLAGLLALASSKPAHAAPKTGEALPSDVVSRMVKALASGDPAVMRALASELRRRNFTKEADELEEMARKVEAAKGGSSSSGSSATPGAGQGPVTDSKQLLAADVVRSLTSGALDRTKLKAFQLQEGLKADGVYGPQSATALIKYGFVPPTPQAWPKGQEAKAKAAYVTLLKLQAEKDSLRREEWLQAAALVGAPNASPNAASAPKPAFTDSSSSTKIPTLRVGARGNDVVFLQRLLNQNGAAIKMDGNFTQALKATVQSFQRTHHDAQGKPLAVDGVVGEKTWRALGAFN